MFLVVICLQSILSDLREYDQKQSELQLPNSNDSRKYHSKNWKTEKSYIYLYDTKNRSDERVFIDHKTRELLLRLERSRFTEANKHYVKSPFLFPQKRNLNGHITGSSIAKKINALNENSVVENLWSRLHTFGCLFELYLIFL